MNNCDPNLSWEVTQKEQQSKQQGDIFRKNYVFMPHKTAASGPVGLLGLM